MTEFTQLSASGIRYLLKIQSLIEAGIPPKNVTLSHELQCTRPSVHAMLVSLTEKGLLACKSRGVPALTPAGEETAKLYCCCKDALLGFFPEEIRSIHAVEDAMIAFLAEIPPEDLQHIAGISREKKTKKVLP